MPGQPVCDEKSRVVVVPKPMRDKSQAGTRRQMGTTLAATDDPEAGSFKHAKHIQLSGKALATPFQLLVPQTTQKLAA